MPAFENAANPKPSALTARPETPYAKLVLGFAFSAESGPSGDEGVVKVPVPPMTLSADSAVKLPGPATTFAADNVPPRFPSPVMAKLADCAVVVFRM